MNVFVSVLPGRIRLRHALLRDGARHAALCHRLRGIVDVESDPKVGSLLLRYDPADTTMAARIRAEVASVFALEDEAGRDASWRDEDEHPALKQAAPTIRLHLSRRRMRTDINRIAKVGALGGMAASLAALGVSRKLHAQIGVIAAGMMLIHVALHWRRVLR